MIFNDVIFGVSGLSVISSLAILVLYMTIKQIRIPSYRLILYLTFGNLLQAISRILVLLYIEENFKALCQTAFTFLGIGDMEALIWTLLYSLQTNMVLVSASRGQNPKFLFHSKKVELIIVVLGAIVPSIMVASVYIIEYRTVGEIFCSTTGYESSYNEIDMLMDFVNVLFVIFFLVIVIFNLMLLKKMVLVPSKRFKSNINILKRRMIIFNFVFLFCNSGCVTEIIFGFTGSTLPRWLQYYSNFALSIWGFANACSVACTPLLIREVRKRLGWTIDFENNVDTILTTISHPNSSNSLQQNDPQWSAKFGDMNESKLSPTSNGAVQNATENQSSTIKSESSWLSEV